MQNIFGISAGPAASTAAPTTVSAASTAAGTPAAAAVLIVCSAAVTGDAGLMLDWLEIITFPAIPFTLEDHVRQQVQTQFNPLSGPWGSHGLEMLRDLISFLNSES